MNTMFWRQNQGARLPRIMERDGVGRDEAAVRARRMDNQRQAYVQRYYHHFWADPLLFDAQFNTGRVTIEETVMSVASIIESRATQPHVDAG